MLHIFTINFMGVLFAVLVPFILVSFINVALFCDKNIQFYYISMSQVYFLLLLYSTTWLLEEPLTQQ